MVIATLTALFLLFGGSKLPFSQPLDVTTKQVKAFVQDEARRDRALAVLTEMEELGKQDRAQRKEYEKSLVPLAARRSATLEEYQATYTSYKPRETAVVERSFDLRFKLKDTLTREEWAKVFPPPGPAASPATTAP